MVGKLDDYITPQLPEEGEPPKGWVRLEVPFTSVPALKQWRDLMGRFMETIGYYCEAPAPGTPHIAERARLAHLREEATRINRICRRENSRPGWPRAEGNDG
jgi:hypothetical protein